MSALGRHLPYTERPRTAKSGRLMIDNVVKASMKLLFSICLMIASSAAFAGKPTKYCGKFSPTDEVSAPLTIDEIERQEMATLPDMLQLRSDYPKVPFGFINAEWVAFKSMVRPGDKIVRYSTDKHSWQNLAGESGYALMRSGCLVETFKTMRN